MKLFNKKQIKELEATANNNGIANLVLMEHAAYASFNFINSILDIKNTCFTVLLGAGNNAGDGLSLARMLLAKGANLYLFKCFDNFSSSLANKQYEILKNSFDLKYCNIDTIPNNSVIIDAVFGIGFNNSLDDNLIQIFNFINAKYYDVISLDIPSGVNSDNGEIYDTAIKATYTISYLAPKIGNYISPGSIHSGKVIEHDLFINNNLNSNVNYIDAKYIKETFNKLKRVYPDTHKNKFGSVAVYASKFGMEGASSLAIEAAINSGAGLLTLISIEEDIKSLRSRYNLTKEIIISKESLNDLNKYDVLLIGPGFDELKENILVDIIKNFKNKLVIDASALKVLAKAAKLDLIKDNKNIILTPHPGEMASLNKETNINNKRLECISNFTNTYKVLCVLKGYRTIISDAFNFSVNSTGNPALSKAGSGDVLAGLIASFWAQGLNSYESAELGVYIHGLISDLLIKKISCLSINPQDIIDNLKEVLTHEYLY